MTMNSMPWKRILSRSGEEQTDTEDQLSMVPAWSVALATVVFIGTQYLFHGVMPHHRPEMLPARMLTGFATGTAFASLILLVGYVSRDAKRRRMPTGLWILIVALLPGGIGAVVYFILRQPILRPCPHCRAEIASSSHFCPQCQFQLAPVCGQCYRGVQITDAFCAQCGHKLEEDHAPARLRAYSD